MSSILKDTSWTYGEESQRRQVAKYRDRANNHWRHRFALADKLVNDYALPRLQERATGAISLVDVGCSIGTFAIEGAKRGFKSYGVDFDPAAIRIAEELSRSEGVSPTFICGDVATCDLPPIDIAICFDIFEHLHDDELGALLGGLRRRLSTEGCIVFHTFPTELDYLFHDPR